MSWTTRFRRQGPTPIPSPTRTFVISEFLYRAIRRRTLSSRGLHEICHRCLPGLLGTVISRPAAPPAVLTSKSTTTPTGSRSPGSTAQPQLRRPLWPSLCPTMTTHRMNLQNLLFRWAQSRHRYATRRGQHRQLSSSVFQDCQTGLYVDIAERYASTSRTTLLQRGQPVSPFITEQSPAR